MEPNLTVTSNLMIVVEGQDDREYRYVPGDYIGQIYPNFIDSRNIDKYLTKKQIIEFRQYLICHKCHKPCAGTCDL